MTNAEALARLYNRAKPFGRGVMHYSPLKMTVEEAGKILDFNVGNAQNGQVHVDYLRGRLMKCWIGVQKDAEARIDTSAYDRDYGPDSALDALTGDWL